MKNLLILSFVVGLPLAMYYFLKPQELQIERVSSSAPQAKKSGSTSVPDDSHGHAYRSTSKFQDSPRRANEASPEGDLPHEEDDSDLHGALRSDVPNELNGALGKLASLSEEALEPYTNDLRLLLSHHDVEVVTQVIRILTKQSKESAADALTPLLHHESEMIRKEVALALGQPPAPASIPSSAATASQPNKETTNPSAQDATAVREPIHDDEESEDTQL